MTADKPEGAGWDNLGPRKPKFIALHRMWGTLSGTDQHFGNPEVPSLTDYGIGVEAIDGAARAGRIHRYNDPLGVRAGWASGRVSAPYGDGAAIVAKYGINAVNRDGVSVEISGYEDEPLDATSWAALVALCGYWIDWMRIPYTALPRNPHTGINALIWHEEFTYGTGKRCPFRWVKAETNRLYREIARYLEPYQTGKAGVPQPAPVTPLPTKPTWARPVPIAELAAVADGDEEGIAAVVTREADAFVWVADRVRAVRDTARRQYASATAARTGPDIKEGEEFDVDWLVKAADGEWWYITGWWTRVRVSDTEWVADLRG